MSSQLTKITAHSSHLLTFFIQLRERYALLHPMLFAEHVSKQYGSWAQARGFTILKSSLFLSCCQDIAKLATDNHDKTPSISKIMTALDDPVVRSQFRTRYGQGRSSCVEDESDPGMTEVYRRMALEDAVKDGLEFDAKYAEAVRLWGSLSASASLKGFRQIRDKVTAHTELSFTNGEYKPIDIAVYEIKWGDLKSTIEEMQRLVELIGQLIRDAGFAWESLDRMLIKAGNDFWCDRPAIEQEVR